jgi:hypothetical protein
MSLRGANHHIARPSRLHASLNSAGRAADTFGIRKTLFDEFTDRYFPGPAIRDKVRVNVAKEHSWVSKFALEVRNVETGCSAADQPHEFGDS